MIKKSMMLTRPPPSPLVSFRLVLFRFFPMTEDAVLLWQVESLETHDLRRDRSFHVK